jgi:hypothetical protein
MTARLLGLLALSVALLVARAAEACKLSFPQPHLSDETRRATDGQAPRFASPPTVTIHPAEHREEPGGCYQPSGSSCDDAITIRIAVPVSDDQTPAEECGFRLSLVEGTLPEGLRLPEHDVRARGGELFLSWFETDGPKPFSFVLSVAPVDAAANVGESVRLPLSQGDGGCSIAPGARPGTWLLLGLLAFWGTLRGRRR